MKITKITEVKPETVYAIQTSTETFIADGLAHHNCYHCNVGLKGNFVPYEDFMLEKYGQEEIDRLKDLYRRKPITKFTVPQLKEMHEEILYSTERLELCNVIEELEF